MTKYIIIFLLILSGPLYSQNLAFNDLTALLSKSNWESVNQYLLIKGWKFSSSSKGDLLTYETITWGYGMNDYDSDKAQGWFILYSNGGTPAKAFYQFNNKTIYNSIKTAMSSLGMKQVNSEIKDNSLTTEYSNKKYYAYLNTGKAENELSNPTTVYSITLTKLNSTFIYPSSNYGSYTVDTATIDVDTAAVVIDTATFTVYDNPLNGIHKAVHEDGSYVVETYVNGILNGESKIYDVEGNLEHEYIYKHGKLNGPYKTYSGRRLVTSGNYVNDKRQGLHTIYYYNEETGVLSGKSVGSYKDDELNGLWNEYTIVNGKEIKYGFNTYFNGVLNGPSKEIQNDSIMFCNYVNGELSGRFKLYIDILTPIGGILVGDTSKAYLSELGTYSKGRKEDIWKIYDTKKNLIEEVNYINDLKHGQGKKYYLIENVVSIIVYHQNELKSETYYNRGSENLFTGVIKTFYSDMSPKEEITVSEGKRNGISKIFNRDGTLEEESNYISGILQQ